MPNRIKATYTPGRGDLGYSEIIHGVVLRKDHAACHVQGAFEEVRVLTDLVLGMSPTVQDENLYRVLSYLGRNIFSLASFCYMKGDTDKHILPENFLVFLDQEISRLGEELGDCPDFIGHSYPLLSYIDFLRVAIRGAERYYTDWRFSSEVSSHLAFNPHLVPNVNFHAAILNRLPSYLFMAKRKEALLLREQGIPVVPRVWQASVEPFEI